MKFSGVNGKPSWREMEENVSAVALWDLEFPTENSVSLPHVVTGKSELTCCGACDCEGRYHSPIGTVGHRHQLGQQLPLKEVELASFYRGPSISQRHNLPPLNSSSQFPDVPERTHHHLQSAGVFDPLRHLPIKMLVLAITNLSMIGFQAYNISTTNLPVSASPLSHPTPICLPPTSLPLRKELLFLYILSFFALWFTYWCW